MKEASLVKFIANTSTNTIIQNTLILILFYHVSNTFNWECIGFKTRRVTIEDFLNIDDLEYDMKKIGSLL